MQVIIDYLVKKVFFMLSRCYEDREARSMAYERLNYVLTWGWGVKTLKMCMMTIRHV